MSTFTSVLLIGGTALFVAGVFLMFVRRYYVQMTGFWSMAIAIVSLVVGIISLAPAQTPDIAPERVAGFITVTRTESSIVVTIENQDATCIDGITVRCADLSSGQIVLGSIVTRDWHRQFTPEKVLQ